MMVKSPLLMEKPYLTTSIIILLAIIPMIHCPLIYRCCHDDPKSPGSSWHAAAHHPPQRHVLGGKFIP
jgi:hypothetical protein